MYVYTFSKIYVIYEGMQNIFWVIDVWVHVSVMFYVYRSFVLFWNHLVTVYFLLTCVPSVPVLIPSPTQLAEKNTQVVLKNWGEKLRSTGNTRGTGTGAQDWRENRRTNSEYKQQC